jgi:hypothetical protein
MGDRQVDLMVEKMAVQTVEDSGSMKVSDLGKIEAA